MYYEDMYDSSYNGWDQRRETNPKDVLRSWGGKSKWRAWQLSTMWIRKYKIKFHNSRYDFLILMNKRWLFQAVYVKNGPVFEKHTMNKLFAK